MEYTKEHQFSTFYNQAIAAQEGLIIFGGYKKPPELSETDKQSLQKSISIFDKCLHITPSHWQSMLFQAKAHQRLSEHKKASKILETACEIEKNNHIVTLETALEAMHLGLFEKAIYYSEEALKRRANDVALLGNYAMNLLIMEQDEKALLFIEKALDLDPNDQINNNVKNRIEDVISGKKERPIFNQVT